MRRSPRGVARTFVAQAWWTIVLGAGFVLAAVCLTLVRLAVLPGDGVVVAAYLVVVPTVVGFVGLGVVRFTGPPPSMRLVAREPTSGDDLLRQLRADGDARTSSGRHGSDPPAEFRSTR